MFDLLLATALAAILLSAMSTGSGDSSSPRFCRSTSHALSAIREANNLHGVELNYNACYPEGSFEGWDYFPWWSHPMSIDVDVPDAISFASGSPPVYTVPASEWIYIRAEGGEAGHVKVGSLGDDQGWDCENPPPCEPEEVPGHDWENKDHLFEWTVEPLSGHEVRGVYHSKPDEEIFDEEVPPGVPPAAAPDSCTCPHYRCHEERKIWLQMPLPEDGNGDFEALFDVTVERQPTIAYDEVPDKHIQLEVVEVPDTPKVVERDFYITPSAADAGFDASDVHALVDDVNEMLHLEYEHDASDEYTGVLRDYDSNHDGDLDSSRGRYDRYVPVEFEVGDITIWNEHTFPEEFNSNLTGWEAIVTNEAEITIAPDDIIRKGENHAGDPISEDDWWKDDLDKNVIVTERVLRTVVYDASDGYLRLVSTPRGVANLDEGQYNTEVVIEHEAGPEALLHEWGHNMGLLHTDPGGYPAEGHSDNHMNPALNVIGPWISEKELELYGQEGVEPNQYQRWTGIP